MLSDVLVLNSAGAPAGTIMTMFQSCIIKAYRHVDGLMQDCSISIANALEILQSCTKPSIVVLSSLINQYLQFSKQVSRAWMSNYTLQYACAIAMREDGGIWLMVINDDYEI